MTARSQASYAATNGALLISLTGQDGTQTRFEVRPSVGSAAFTGGTYASDLLALAACVYALDRTLLRVDAPDGWSRHIELELPVHAPTRWRRNSDSWSGLLGFLTGDTWTLDFTKQSPVAHFDRQTDLEIPVGGASLFSGGLDSLIGAIDWLEQHPRAPLALVSHYDPAMGGPKSEQSQLVALLRASYPSMIRHMQWRAGLTLGGSDLETTFRSRSLLFIALLACTAENLGYEGPVIIPENGNIALNMPLTPSRVGSCSTRTAHPYYLQWLNALLDAMGFTVNVTNPYEAQSKGQMVSGCLSPATLDSTRHISVSCAKRGHRYAWTNRTARACGVCMPCIYRRASLSSAGKDDDNYGIDFSKDQLRMETDIAADFRAYLMLLSENLSVEQVVERLTVSSPLPYARILELAPGVATAMQEVRALVRDKGTPDMRTRAGISE